MQAPKTVAFILLVVLSAAPAIAEKVTPVQKVLEMLGEMVVHGEAAKEEEAKIFKEYSEWVDDEQFKLGAEIKTAKAEIEDLIAFINQGHNKIEELSAAVEALEAEIATLEGEKKKATSIRAAEKAEYLEVSADYQESLDAIAQAIQVLGAEPASAAQAEMLLQRMAVKTSGMRRVLAAFLQERAQAMRGGPAVAAYENHSSGIIEMLEGLKTKFKDELDDVNTQEANRAHAYDLEMLHMSDTIAHMSKDVEEKNTAKASLAVAVGEAEGKLADTKAALKEDEATLAEVTATFAEKTNAFNANQKTRGDEIAAIKKAIEIISNPNVAGNYADKFGLAQESANGVSLLQTSSASRRLALKDQTFAYLQSQAVALKSKQLTTLVSQIAGNPFAKVITMIKELLKKLKEEAAAEAEHKAWCDGQLKANKLKRDKLTAEQKRLMAEIEALSAKIAGMAEKIQTLIEEQAELTKAMAEATVQRGKEKTANLATIADCQGAQVAVNKALVILEEFYASQAAFLQKKGSQVPEMKPYKGQQGSSPGVIGMLEVILSDFARLEAETTADEKQAAKEYESFMETAKADKKAKHKEEFQLKLDKDQAEFELSNLQEDLVVVEKELGVAVSYFWDLKPMCLTIHVSYEERVAKREEELAALNKAYEILDQGLTVGF